MDPKADKLVRKTAMVASVTAAYFLLTSDYGNQPNILDPIKSKILSAESTVKEFIFGPKKESQVSKVGGEVVTPAAEKQP
ncbi:hypothetical protein C5167_004374 [Papaver somniferum]|uniref:Uncharacterized protein n=1 Tax=Papaver somniferum TaxID=3469 RepID=A0A4Y7JBG0_PAPSO|nr:uncharacterized protein LOC113273420 [Papaver somniferum]RZC57069.1 hypothetical protein C5167_004374 [Papaver somniferum]